jgi:predicted nucleic acid-binding protein
MRICIDSNQFIFGISGTDPASEILMTLLPHLEVVIPRLVIKEVVRNLNDIQAKVFYSLLNSASNLTINEEPVPIQLIQKSINLGLKEKADAFTGAFAEWQDVKWLISDNRHFLYELTNATFEVITPDNFINQYYRTIVRGE